MQNLANSLGNVFDKEMPNGVKPAPKKGKGERKKRSGRSGSSVKNQIVPGRYKTELCRPFEERGVCRYGSKCQYAHGVSDLKVVDRHPRYKSELCRTFHAKGFCPYGLRCHFIHNELERTVGQLMIESARAQEQVISANYQLVQRLLAMATSTPIRTTTSTSTLLLEPSNEYFLPVNDQDEFRGRSMSLGSAGSSEYSGGSGSVEDSSRFSQEMLDIPLSEYFPRLNCLDAADPEVLVALLRATASLRV